MILSKIIVAFAVLIIFLSLPVSAKEKNDDPPTLSENLLYGLATEAGLILIFRFSADSPKTFGTALAIISPIATYDKNGYEDTWPALLFAESLAIYNISIDEDTETKNEMVKKNMIAFHVGLLIGFTVHSLTKDNKKLKISYLPLKKGGLLNVGYTF